MDPGPQTPFTAALLHYMDEGIEVRKMMDKVRKAVRLATSRKADPSELGT